MSRTITVAIMLSLCALFACHSSTSEKRDIAKSDTLLKTVMEDRGYTVIGIAPVGPNGATIVQWLYVDEESDKLYEYDLSADKLIGLNETAKTNSLR